MNKQIKSVKVFGSGCPTCKKLFELTKQAVTELGLDLEVEYSTDIQKIIELGVMSSPVLVINGQVALVGQLPVLEKIKELIASNSQPVGNAKADSCSCGGKC